MARYALYLEAEADLYLLDVQSDLIDLDTRMIVPIVAASQAHPVGGRLNPTFTLEGRPYVMMTQQMASIPIWELPAEKGSLVREADAISRAIDMLFIGF